MTIADSRMMARVYGARLALVLACLLALFTLLLCYSLEWRGPFRDLWEFIGLVREQFSHQWRLLPLIEPYGGIHRIFLPKLLFYLDIRYASGTNLLALTTTLIFHTTACALLIHAVIRSDILDGTDKIFLAAVIIGCSFSTTQIYNLIYISDNQVPLSNALSIMAAYFAVQAIEQRKTTLLYSANICIGLASLCHSSGLMLWPALIMMLWHSGQSKRWIISQLAIAVIIFSIYLSGNDPLDKQPLSLIDKLTGVIASILLNIGNILRYIGLHLSSPVSREWPITGIIFGYASIAYVTWQLWTSRLRAIRQPPLAKLMLLLSMYGVFIAVVTALGRQIYPNSALTDRYQTLVMTYWLAILCLIYIDLRKQSATNALFSPILAAILLLPWQYQNAVQMQWLSSRVRIAHTAAIVGITDIDSIAATLSHPLLMDNKNLVAEHNDWLRDNKLGYFSEPLAAYFHTPTLNIFSKTLISADCSGKLLSVEPAGRSEHAYKMMGTGQINGQPVREILVLDTKNQVVGLGHTHRERGDFMPQRFRGSTTTTWIGFMKNPLPPDSVYVIIGRIDENFCRLFETRL